MQSIRPLTGSMSIWNHAPEWADGFISEPDGRLVEWLTEDNQWFDNADCIKRPFWATREDAKEKQG